MSYLPLTQKQSLRCISQSLCQFLTSLAPETPEFESLAVVAHHNENQCFSKMKVYLHPLKAPSLPAYQLFKPGNQRVIGLMTPKPTKKSPKRKKRPKVDETPTKHKNKEPKKDKTPQRETIPLTPETGLSQMPQGELIFHEGHAFGSSDLLVFPVSINDWGATRGLPLFSKTYPTYIIPSHCWNDEALIKTFNGVYLHARDVKEGDVLMSASGFPTIVKQVLQTKKTCLVPMVKIDEFYITPGHPVFKDDEWYRPDELFPVEHVWINTLYNFHCQPHHEIIVGTSNWICTSPGGYCPRLAELDPYSDRLFGRGYGTTAAAKYAWLLGNPTRIPNHMVEIETEKYWKQQEALLGYSF